MYEVKVQSNFSAAHNLRNYNGKCEALHGHNWLVEAIVRSPALDEQGMVLDFVLLKKVLTEELKNFDHKYLNDVPPFDTGNPTSENLARHLFERLRARINDGRIAVARVSVWETPTSRASYFENRGGDEF